MRTERTAIAGFFVLLGGGAACEASSAAPTWADMDLEAREAYMRETVEPKMRELFQSYDPVRYSGFGCASCHGPNAQARDYAMPATLFPLPLEGTLDAAFEHDTAMTEFMLDSVFPTFVDLLGETKFNHGTAPDGYRCTGCHAIDGADMEP